MKKTLLHISIIALFFFSFLKSNGQYTLQTARYSGFSSMPFTFGIDDSLTPAGVTIPAGPYYGSMNTNTRPMWYFFPSCIGVKDYFFSIKLPYLLSTGCNGSISVWGPFENISNLALTDLDQSKQIACDNFYISSGMGGYTAAHNNLDSGKVYIFLFTTNDTTQNQDINFGFIISPRFPDPGQHAYINDCYLCNGQATYMEQYVIHNVCIVTVDTPSNHIEIIWEKDASDNGLAGYVVKRQNLFGVFDSIAFIPHNAFSSFTDTTVNAIQQKRFYKVISVDSCMQEYETNIGGSVASPIYLQSYPGLNNVVNLTWDFQNLIIDNVIPAFYVWRSSNYGAFQLIDSVSIAGGGNTKYYTDVNAPTGPASYAIEVRQSTPCYPSFISGYGSSLSNPSGVMVLGVNDYNDFSFIKLIPNPTNKGEVKFDFGFALIQPLLVTMYAVDGKRADAFVVEQGMSSYRYNAKNLASGVYYVNLTSSEIVKTIKLVVY